MSGFVVSSDEVREIDAISGQRANIIVSSYDGPSPHIPESHHHENPESQEDAVVISNAALPSVATLCNSAIGAGVLSLPFAFRKTGMQLSTMHAWILICCAVPVH